jgi:CPA2 family monovalent cation:H+ antiporter-2
MPDERALIVDLIIIIGAATGGGVVASVLRQPAVLGYVVAGFVVVNYVPGLEIDLVRVRDVAELGVALLLFSLGVQFSPAKLTDVRRVAVLGGALQIGLTIALGVAIARPLGLDVEAGVLLGAVMSLSSTMVVLKLLDARGELEALHGRVALGILLVQDLAVVPMVILIPAAAGEGGGALAGELALAAAKAAGLLAAAYVLGAFAVPWLLARVVRFGQRELFLLAVLSLAFGLAAGSYALGLSVAFGAFLAGLIVSESEFSFQTLADVLPIREVFATIFFVSMGALIEPEAVAEEPAMVAAITATVVVGKLVLVSTAVAWLGYPGRTALLTGLALAQAGEFSFVLAQVGLDEEIISAEVNSAILMSTLISILLTPLLLQAGPRIVALAAGAPLLRPFLVEAPVTALEGEEEVLRQHVVVCGFDEMGRELVREVRQRDFRCVVIDHNPYQIEQLARLGVPRVYGDAASPAVLAAARIQHARVLAVTVPDPAVAQLILEQCRRLNPRIHAIVRGRSQEDHDALLAAGAAEVIHPEFEAGLEFVRHTLYRFGVDRTQIQALLARRRRDLHAHD